MVSKDLKIKILHVIGRNMIEKFQDFLMKNAVRNRNGQPFSKPSLRNYIYNDHLNQNLDPYFLDFSEKELARIQEIKDQKQAILEKSKQLAS